ncbi:MAG: hypothetical protein WAW69_03370, partial [Polaromonas sp.]
NTAVQPGGGVANAGVGLDAGVRAGANGNVRAEDRMAVTGAAGAGAQAEVSSGLKSGVSGTGNTARSGAPGKGKASVDIDALAGVKGAVPVR